MYITSDKLEKGEEIWDRVCMHMAEKYKDLDHTFVIINRDFAPPDPQC